MKLLADVSRITAGGLLCRCLTFMFTLVALVLAVPPWAVEPRLLAFVTVAAAAVAAFPGSRIVSLALLGAIAGWIITLLDGTEQPTPWKVIAFASAVYLSHSAAGLA